MDRRSKARELSIQMLYQLDVQGDEAMDNLEVFLRENEEDELVRNLAGRWTREMWYNRERVDELIEGSMIRWGIGRLSLVDKSILRLAVYQLKYCKDIPPKVSINEAIELAKRFGAEQSAGFVNGVLDAALKRIEQGCDEVKH